MYYSTGITASGADTTTSSMLTFTNFFSWSCENCKHSEEHKCSECGCNKLKCNKFNIIIDKDFYCKEFDSKGTIIVPQPYAPLYPTAPAYPCPPILPWYDNHYNLRWMVNSGNYNRYGIR